MEQQKFVFYSLADHDAIVNEEAHKLALTFLPQKQTDINSKGEEVEPIIINGERFLSRKNTSKMLEVGYPTLWRWNKEGILKAIKVGRRKVYYRYDDIFNLLRGNNND